MNWQKDWIKWRRAVVVIDESRRVVRGWATDCKEDGENPRMFIKTVDSPEGRWYHPRYVLPDVFVWLSDGP
jgi:hypothetical protein